ncbi:hypothetical protein QA644_08135 [Rhizobium sp. CC1099]|uniref:hypothetical protein n=1 Tax=Rhizobium sp. CC1099 TaxID=3039160 RepID=UPI0024B1DAF0|nr:hypothetical protein [Rhizobium sp. CC1099]WFU88998.1 hypothetical protein QA644_08135 [Rhizobium sp. CC1099]
MAKVVTITAFDSNSGFASHWIIDGGIAKYVFDPTITVAATNLRELAVILSKGLVPSLEFYKDKDPSKFCFEASETDIGHYFPRLYRPFVGTGSADTDEPPSDQAHRKDAIRQFRILWRDLQILFEHVHPDSRNLSAFGDRIRNLILLCAMEVENQLRGILRANAYPEKTVKRLNFGDYQKIEPYAGLSHYCLEYSQYENLGFFRPFDVFEKRAPDWWDAYNQIKHDRYKNQHIANLGNALAAFTAFGITIIAQHGYGVMYQGHDGTIMADVLKMTHQPSLRPVFRNGSEAWTAQPVFQRR